MIALLRKARKRIDPNKLWVNSDCGLKTRQWQGARDALAHMSKAAKTLRSDLV
jgi:5-methyltetrahydropteroyltriglutamate--homocysteine methyltransferase